MKICISTDHRLADAGLVYCIDYLDSNLDWLLDKLENLQEGEEVCE